MQEIYNKLYCSIAEDEEWIYDTIKDLIPVEPIARALWGIYEAARYAGYVQSISAGVFRSDYMFHLAGPTSDDSRADLSKTTLKQVEFNSVSCSGFSHANKVANMHRYLARAGVYDVKEKPFDVSSLPVNRNIESVASILALAHQKYGPPKSKLAKKTAVLFIVQPYNVGITCSQLSAVRDMPNPHSSLTSRMSDRSSMLCGIEMMLLQTTDSISAPMSSSIPNSRRNEYYSSIHRGSRRIIQ